MPYVNVESCEVLDCCIPVSVVGSVWAEGCEAGPGAVPGDPASPQQGAGVGEAPVPGHPHRHHHVRLRVSVATRQYQSHSSVSLSISKVDCFYLELFA